MGYKTRTPRVQIFLGYKRSKWGTVHPNGRAAPVPVLTGEMVPVMIGCPVMTGTSSPVNPVMTG